MNIVLRAIATAICVAGSLAWASATAQQWPARPIIFVAPSAPATGGDIIMRTFAERLSQRTGWQTVVENRPGGNFIVGAQYVVQAPPDGYTLLQAGSNYPLLPLTTKNLPFDFQRDFLPVTRMATIDSLIAVHPSVPASNLAELVAYSKANPGKLGYTSSGASSPLRLAVEWIKTLTGLDASPVEYKSGSLAMPDLLAGRVPIGVSTLASLEPHIRSGKLRGVVMLQRSRNPNLPDIQSTADVGMPQVDSVSWYGLMLPAKTPQAIIDRLHAESVAVLQLPEVKASYAKLGAAPVWETPAEFARRIADELQMWPRIVREAKLKLE